MSSPSAPSSRRDRLRERACGLQHQLGQHLLDLGALDLEHRDLGARRAPAAQLVEEAQVGDLQRHQLDLEPRQLVAEARIVGERLAVLALARGERLQLLELALGRADARGVHPLVAEQVLRHGPALAFVVHAVLDRHLDVVEEHFVHFVAAVHQDQRAHGDARRAHVDQQERYPVLLALERRRRCARGRRSSRPCARASSRSSGR